MSKNKFFSFCVLTDGSGGEIISIAAVIVENKEIIDTFLGFLGKENIKKDAELKSVMANNKATHKVYKTYKDMLKDFTKIYLKHIDCEIILIAYNPEDNDEDAMYADFCGEVEEIIEESANACGMNVAVGFVDKITNVELILYKDHSNVIYSIEECIKDCLKKYKIDIMRNQPKEIRLLCSKHPIYKCVTAYVVYKRYMEKKVSNKKYASQGQ